MRCAVLVAAAWLVVHELHVVLAPGLDLGILEHRGIHVAVLLVAASSCLLASLRRDTERLPWLLIGLGLAGWTAGEAVYVTVMWDDTSPPIPSPADYGYLLLPALLLPGLWLLLRSRAAAVSRTLWADGVTVGLAVSSVSAALVFQTLYTHVSGDPVGVGVALAYPLTDMVMLAAIAGSLAGIGWRLDRRWSLLAGGIVAFWLADSLYAISAVAGTYDAGGWFDIGWWGGLLAIGVAAWQPNRTSRPGGRPDDPLHPRAARLRAHRARAAGLRRDRAAQRARRLAGRAVARRGHGRACCSRSRPTSR